MQLELAIVQSCSEDGCKVQLLDSGESIHTVFSPAIIDYQIKIIPHQLIIVNRSTTPPQLAWRWTRATVNQISENQIDLTHDDGRQLQARRADDLNIDLSPSDVVFLTGFNAENWTIVDVAINGNPTNPDRLSAALFPTFHD